ncbi:MAG: sigma factor-like helix-turn-helix DNA-binding protein [Atribacterota bacterium]
MKQYRGQLFEILNNMTDFSKKDIKKIVSKVISVGYNFYEDTRINIEEIRSELKVILIESIKKFRGSAEPDRVVYQFLKYLDNTLYYELQHRVNMMTQSEEDDKNYYNLNIESFGVPIEVIDDGYIEESFEDGLISNIYLNEFKQELSTREKQVFDMLFILDYTQRSIANELGITQQAVNIYKNRILAKFRKYVC